MSRQRGRTGRSAARWRPRPLDTRAVRLPPDLKALTELLAENAHDLWATQRLREGWTYGPARDDAARRHPDLVAYADLPEREKHYDRRTAMQTLRAIIALGYAIERRCHPSIGVASPAAAHDVAGRGAGSDRRSRSLNRPRGREARSPIRSTKP